MQNSFIKIYLIFILVFLASCSTANETNPSIDVTFTSSANPTTLTPTKNSPTPTSIPLTATEEVVQEGDTYTMTENGREYTYTYIELGENQEGETVMENVRDAGGFFVFDWPTFNGARYQFFITEKALNERNLYQINQPDFTKADIPSGGVFDPPPITAAFSHMLEEATGKTLPTLIQEMQEKGVSLEIIIHDGMSEGKKENVILSTETGFIVTAMDKETMFELVQDPSFISTGHVDGIEYYAQVYDVDKNGNMLCRLAFSVPLNEVPDTALRKALFIFPASLTEKRDLRDIEQSGNSKFLAHMSEQLRTDGTQDLNIVRVPETQP
jgi:hypothetical protein